MGIFDLIVDIFSMINPYGHKTVRGILIDILVAIAFIAAVAAVLYLISKAFGGQLDQLLFGDGISDVQVEPEPGDAF